MLRPWECLLIVPRLHSVAPAINSSWPSSRDSASACCLHFQWAVSIPSRADRGLLGLEERKGQLDGVAHMAHADGPRGTCQPLALTDHSSFQDTVRCLVKDSGKRHIVIQHSPTFWARTQAWCLQATKPLVRQPPTQPTARYTDGPKHVSYSLRFASRNLPASRKCRRTAPYKTAPTRGR
ncbi:hypothetical protein C8R47DRAFT_558817 [Mycena vitilis]|nr:hypothetical protein C8R47DRAFT_558817 [Mycena vitilis]